MAFYDAVLMDAEQDPSTSYDSGTHGTHVAGIAVGTGGGQTTSLPQDKSMLERLRSVSNKHLSLLRRRYRGCYPRGSVGH